MYRVDLPISKSIAQRRLMRCAVEGLPLPDISTHNLPRDIQVLQEALQQDLQSSAVIDCRDNGTALRFLTAYFATKEGADVFLSGTERLCRRPISQLVDALRSLGADIEYSSVDGLAPLHIRGRRLSGGEITILQPQSTQFISALMLVSRAIERGITIHTDIQSPYIQMTEQVLNSPNTDIERDWSAAAFWYEAVAIHGGSCVLPLTPISCQGDKAIIEIFSKLGVTTTPTADGLLIERTHTPQKSIEVDFSTIPDAYPAVFAACHQLSTTLISSGIDSLPHKESNRLLAMQQLLTDGYRKLSHNDHRIAMALLVANCVLDDYDCISKSYPDFRRQYTEWLQTTTPSIDIIIPLRHGTTPNAGNATYVDDEGRGKKWALKTGIEHSQTELVWLRDNDVTLSSCTLSLTPPLAAMYILPLRMACPNGTFIECLQQTEYTIIQSLTLWSAERGHPLMCAGANLIVNRRQWLQSYTDIHTDIASGDDMFILESFRRRGLLIRPLYSPDLIATTNALPSLRTLLRQRMRWAGKALHYSNRDIILCGALTLLLGLSALLFPPLLLLLYFIACLLLHRSKRYNLYIKKSYLWAVPLILLYPVYMLVSVCGGLIRSKSNW